MKLEDWRLLQGLSNNRLAEMLGVDKSTVSRLRRRVTVPLPETAKKIVELTDGNVSMADLYGGKNP